MTRQEELGFWTIIRRFTHLLFGHKFDGSKEIEKQIFKKHPNSNEEMVYSVTVRKCCCGLAFLDKGLSFTEIGEKRWYP